MQRRDCSNRPSVRNYFFLIFLVFFLFFNAEPEFSSNDSGSWYASFPIKIKMLIREEVEGEEKGEEAEEEAKKENEERCNRERLGMGREKSGIVNRCDVRMYVVPRCNVKRKKEEEVEEREK